MEARSADRNVWTRRRLLSGAASGFAGILALGGRAPAFSQAAPKKLVMAHIVASPESSAVAFTEMADAVNKQEGSGLEIEFHAGTLLTKELEVINAVKSGNIAIGDPGGAAATVFPEMGVFLVPYLVKSYDQAYKMFNGAIGERLDRLEGRHQRAQAEHDLARRGLERLTPRELEELRRAWRRYCEVIAELDQSSAEFEALLRR